MKRRSCTIIAILVGLILLPQARALASGMGPFLAVGGDISTSLGFPQFVLEELSISDEGMRIIEEGGTINASMVHFTIGFLYDSAPMREGLFNYRLAAGFDLAAFGSMSVYIPPGLGAGDQIIMDNQKKILEASLNSPSVVGVTVNNTFGFSLLRNERLKWWAGPCVRLNANYYLPDIDIYTSSSTVTAVLGGGVETGVNYAVGSGTALSVSLGYTYNAMGYLLRSPTDNASFIWGHGSCIFFQVGVLFNRGPDAILPAANPSGA